MTFGEAIEDAFGCTDELDTISSFIDIINELKQEYVPTIEMTKAEKTMLLNYLEMSSLREFMDVILYQDGNLYEKLSDEDIVHAWLYPETIKVVD